MFLFILIWTACFFVSVGLRDRPQLLGKTVAVSHFKGTTSTTARETDKRLPTESMSDIASCNFTKLVLNVYVMARVLEKVCSDVLTRPYLIIIPYEFEKYIKVFHIHFMRPSYPSWQKLKLSVVLQKLVK